LYKNKKNKTKKAVAYSLMGVFTRSSKRLANVFKTHAGRLLEVCWMYAESCKHPNI